jgi:hypothetical protein
MTGLLIYVAWGCFAGSALTVGGIFLYIFLELKKEREVFIAEEEKERAVSIEDIRRRNAELPLSELVSTDNSARSAAGVGTSSAKKE